MSLDRKRLVRAIFDQLDIDQEGKITVDTLRSHFISDHDQYHIKHFHFESKRIHDIIRFMTHGSYGYEQSTHVSHHAPDASLVITWTGFLDYYRCLSLGLDDDDEIFEYVVRYAWDFSTHHHPHHGHVRTTHTTTTTINNNNMPVTQQPHSQTSSSSSPSLQSRPYSTNAYSLKGRFASPSRRNVLVIHSNGREEVVEIEDELGKTKLDARSLINNLHGKGVYDISDIRI
jgi:hypothetical protein